MGIEALLIGYPSRVRFADWQAANEVPANQLPPLSPAERERARNLFVDEDGYAVALEAGRRSHPDAGIVALVADADDFGVWLAPRRSATSKVAGVPWRYLRAVTVDLDLGVDKTEKNNDRV